ncbi:hypothetical protein WJX81_004791 [Elliptochloris bilobata]|uniref:Uncharacterized protein n=1 Tax=Elliptochloris bilobata TaxID=381761 RepID=A0AAW1RHV3_9CHLO
MATSVLTFVIVGDEDHPIFEADLAAARGGDASARDDQGGRAQYLHQFVLHAALDAVEEQQWQTSAMHLGVVDKFNNLQVSAFVTAAQVTFLLLHDGRNDDSVKLFFRDVYEVYLRVILNPFFSASAKLTSPALAQKVGGASAAACILATCSPNTGLGVAPNTAAEAPPSKRTRLRGPGSGGAQPVSRQARVVKIEGVKLSKRKLSEEEILAIPGLPGLPDVLGDHPLRLLIGGNNPSEHAWRSGHYYSHPANHMWRLLIQTGIAPASVQGPADDWRMPREAGVAFLDVGFGHPGTHLAAFSSQTFQSWVPAFYARLAAHMQRSGASVACVCGRCGAPAVVAFSGKRQWVELLNTGRPRAQWVKTVPLGPQDLRPQGWPFPAETEAAGEGQPGVLFTPYEVIEVNQTYSVRLYVPRIVARTFYERRDEGFLRLGRYFDESNLQQAQPIVMRYPAEGSKTMELYVDSAKAPQPTNEEVWLDVAGGELVAVLSLPGSATQAACEAARQRLADALARDGRNGACDQFALGQYGPINSLAPRLNEIYLRIL